MKKVAVCSKIDFKKIKRTLIKNGFIITNKNPDWILCYGGDGTILYAERKYPSIPKLPIKRTKICHKCEIKYNNLGSIVKKIKNGNYKIVKEMKLEVSFKNKKLLALNEIHIHTKIPIRALRFSLQTNNKKFNNLIGDGVVVSTPFGSTAYYSSTGGKPFKKGIGISFNNLFLRKINSFVIPDRYTVKIKIEREPALLFADNNEKFLELKPNDKVLIRKSKDFTRFVQIV